MTYVDLLKPLAEALIAVLVAVIISLRPRIVRYIDALVDAAALKAGVEQADLLSSLAYEAVVSAARLGNTNDEKKSMAVNYVVMALAERGISVTPEVVGAAVEAALSIKKGV